MLVRSDELGDELKQARSLLTGSIHGEEGLRRLADRYCCPGDLRDAVRDMKKQSMAVDERTDRDKTPPL